MRTVFTFGTLSASEVSHRLRTDFAPSLDVFPGFRATEMDEFQHGYDAMLHKGATFPGYMNSLKLIRVQAEQRPRGWTGLGYCYT